MYFSKTKPIKVLFSNPRLFLDMYLKWFGKIVYTKYTHKVIKPRKYAGKDIISEFEGNEIIKNLLNSGKPFVVGRPGATEIYMMLQAEMIENDQRTPVQDDEYKMAYVNSGVFPRTAEMVKKFGLYEAKLLHHCELMNVSYCVLEDYIYKKYMDRNAEMTYIRALDYWRFKEPWTAALAGKKVLVISPFAKTIEGQYARREKLYKEPNVLPKFTLYTVKAVQTGGMESDDRFADWFEALEYMYDEAMKYDFDVAILSCGAYSLPLAVKFKQAGRSAIHMGGVCQMLFGIKGRRFEDEPGASDFFNEYWVYPSADETPKSASSIENSAYWAREEK